MRQWIAEFWCRNPTVTYAVLKGEMMQKLDYGLEVYRGKEVDP